MRKTIIHRIMSIFLIVVGVAGFICLVGIAAKSEIAAEKVFLSINLESKIDCVLRDIENRQIQQAVVSIENDILSDESIDLPVKQYFENFISYYNHVKNPVFTKSEINTQYFLNNSSYLCEYLRKNSFHNQIEASRLAEIVPYFFISIYDQNQKKNTDLYKSYLKVFTINDTLSEKSADILCLYVQSMYKTNKKNDDFQKEEMAIIKKYQEKYSKQLGDNGIYEKSSIYLSSFYNYLFRQTNKKINWWMIETAPKYTLQF